MFHPSASEPSVTYWRSPYARKRRAYPRPLADTFNRSAQRLVFPAHGMKVSGDLSRQTHPAIVRHPGAKDRQDLFLS
jgi:hypothetical protein